jgi:hypothetical protein
MQLAAHGPGCLRAREFLVLAGRTHRRALLRLLEGGERSESVLPAGPNRALPEGKYRPRQSREEAISAITTHIDPSLRLIDYE